MESTSTRARTMVHVYSSTMVRTRIVPSGTTKPGMAIARPRYAVPVVYHGTNGTMVLDEYHGTTVP
jgi:hypothetical protein